MDHSQDLLVRRGTHEDFNNLISRINRLVIHVALNTPKWRTTVERHACVQFQNLSMLFTTPFGQRRWMQMTVNDTQNG